MSELAERARFYNPYLAEALSRPGNHQEESDAMVAIAHFVTNPQGSIYALTGYVPELFAALLKARYSRTELTAKQLLWREFVVNKEGIPWERIDEAMVALDYIFDYKRARGLAERVLAQYGDDSGFELGGAHLFFDRVSQPAAKVIEDTRIGLSPLEKSTRYVFFDQKGPDGDYAFFRDPKIMDSPYRDLYLKTTRACFELYAKSVVVLQEHFRQLIPIESEQFPDFSDSNFKKPFSELTDEKSIKAAKIAYNQSIRAKACDVARVLLPASTLTNIGVFGNARAFGYLMTKMIASPMAEMQMIAEEATAELKKVLPKFFDIVDNERGLVYQNFLRQTDAALQRRAQNLLIGETPVVVNRVELVEMDPDPEINIAAALLYPYSNLPLRQLIDILQRSNPSVIGDVIHDSLRFRTNRRHKPPRAFEIAGYELVFDILGNFGIYRDLQRQRMLTQQRQPYTTEHGFDMPVEFTEIGLDGDFVAQMDGVEFAHNVIAADYPLESQYLTTLANYMRWCMGMNLREGFWVTELRSVPQGHFSYRTVAQDMFLKAQKRYPFLADLKPQGEHFVDMTDRSKNLERMEAMQRIQTKIAQIEDKYS